MSPTRYKTGRNYHRKNNRIGIGSKVYSRIGEKKKQHPSHKRSTRSKVFGHVLSSVSDNEWCVAFEDGTKRDMKSKQIFIANDEDVSVDGEDKNVAC